MPAGLDIEMRRDVPLAPLTTIGVGGSARYWCEVTSLSALKSAFSFAERSSIPVFLLGGGSNVVFPDAGFDGLVIQLANRGLSREDVGGNHVNVHVQAGEDWDRVVAWTVAQGLAGIECLSGIPGKAGAAPIQNIGAYGQDVSETLKSVECYDRENGEVVVLDNAVCQFSYRDSLFKSGHPGRFVVMAMTFGLVQDGAPAIRYPDLQKRLAGEVSLQAVRDMVLAVRREKSMVADPLDINSRGCGSFFTNPILDAQAYAAFAQRCAREHPHWPAGESRVKLAAAWLIENAGYAKGFRLGNAGLSEKHCLAITNRGGATSADVKALAETIQAGVYDRFGVRLVPEPIVL